MPVQVINGVGTAGIGTGSSSQSGGGSSPMDSDAQAFITAASITATTQQNAVNQLVTALKSAGIWTKMKAIYPMVGGTSLSHKWNLKDPRDLDAAYRLVFNGGWSHTSSGATPNGTTGYANTNLVPNTVLSGGPSSSFGMYSRTNSTGANRIYGVGGYGSTAPPNQGWGEGYMHHNIGMGNFYNSTNSAVYGTYTANPSTGFFVVNRTIRESTYLVRNSGLVSETSYNGATYSTLPMGNFYFGAYNDSNRGGTLGTYYFSNHEISFAFIGESLTDTQLSNFYLIVEAYQVALNRSVTSPSITYNNSYEPEVNAFILNGGITNSTQISATNTLVKSLKTSGVWSKLIALYPMVGGTVDTHKWNLKSPSSMSVYDSNYKLTFYGGWTHSSTGAKPNGTDGYANTGMGGVSLTSMHYSYYSRTNSNFGYDIGHTTQITNLTYFALSLRNNNLTSYSISVQENPAVGEYISNSRVSNTDSTGFFVANRTSNSVLNGWKNGSKVFNSSQNSAFFLQNNGFAGIIIGALRGSVSSVSNYTDRECSLASIGNGLTDAEVTSFTNAVQAFQTTLGRQV